MVNTAYKIKDVVDRSGFSAATLRYYEEIGILPPSARTPAGYRLYDDHALDRLAFVARAKQLGCSLDEIVDLAAAWEGGTCGPVQDRLRSVVSDKLSSAQHQIAELNTLITELRAAATALGGHRPSGACDDLCGCTSASPPERPVPSASEPTPQRVILSAKPIACTLGADVAAPAGAIPVLHERFGAPS